MCTRNLLLCLLIIGCRNSSPTDNTINRPVDSSGYIWQKLADSTAFPAVAHFQMMNIRDTLWALHPNGNYYSSNGIDFSLALLPPKVSSQSIPAYLFSNNKLIAINADGNSDSNREKKVITFKSNGLLEWNQQASSDSLPSGNLYRPIGFKGKIWLFLNSDSSSKLAAAWNSTDAIHWNKVADSIPIGRLENPQMIVFKKKLLLLAEQLWESDNGIHWKKVSTTMIPSFEKATPVEFNELLWIFGAGTKKNGYAKILVSKDTRKWDTLNAPWLERSSPALCIFRGKIIMSGGNHPVISGNLTADSLLNDVWQMEYFNE